MIDKGVVTYRTSWGNVKDVRVDQNKYDSYFADLGITPQQVTDLVGLSDWDLNRLRP